MPLLPQQPLQRVEVDESVGDRQGDDDLDGPGEDGDGIIGHLPEEVHDLEQQACPGDKEGASAHEQEEPAVDQAYHITLVPRRKWYKKLMTVPMAAASRYRIRLGYRIRAWMPKSSMAISTDGRIP